MKKMKSKYANDKRLFQIGEAAKVMNLSRRMILNYEENGLLSPAVKDVKSGYRYFTADNLTQIALVRSLQGLGMSLIEIKEYLNDTLQLTDTIKRLEQLRSQLDVNIAKLQVRMDVDSFPKFYWTTLPKQTGYYKKFHTDTLADRTNELRDGYIEAARIHQIRCDLAIFAEVSFANMDDRSMFIPLQEECCGEHVCVIPEVRAICTYHRGSYEKVPEAFQQLLAYVLEKGFKPSGTARAIYLEGPPNRGADKDKYITQIAIPVEDNFDTIPKG